MKNKDRVIVVTAGGFDPLNGEGHITHFQEAHKLGDILIVILSRDDQLIAKGNKLNGTFYPRIEDRIAIIEELRSVDKVVISIDNNGECAETLRLLRPNIFAKGGEYNKDNLPESELKVCKEIGCRIVYEVGKEKTTSSSKLIRNNLK